jgi:uncharacterized metal-binding protein
MGESNQSQAACWCERSGYAVLCCSGASIAGDIAHRAGREVAARKNAHVICLSSVAAGDREAIWMLRQAKEILALDGCSKDCARNILRQAGFQESAHLRVTDLGLGKDQGEPSPDSIAYAAAEADRLIGW